MRILESKLKLLKKIFSLLIITSILLNNLFLFNLSAVETNSSATPWSMQKAEHLARRALIWPNPDIVKQLYDAWSASAALNLLFPSVSWPDRTAYETELNAYKEQNFSATDSTKMTRYYLFKYYKDPYEAKVKLFSLFEDIFSVDKTDDILYTDVENHFDILYSETLWNYKRLIKRVVYDTTKPESSYAMWRYLDLLNNPDKNRPNENYARELMQLFLMLEYKPWENAETPWAIRNYSEEDVASLAKILTWFKAWNDKKVYFDNNFHNTSTDITFLSWALKSWDSFPFYNTASWTINNTIITTPIWGNNWLWDNAIDYIFSKREAEIAYFLAYRMFKFYVHDNPTKEDIIALWNNILSNNFEIFPSVKYLLESDMMYSDKAMNSIRYKNPLELTIWTLKLLHYKNPWINDILLTDTSLLSNFDWAAYNPRSIFGRAWFDNNLNFMNSYFHNSWVTYASKIAFTTWTWAYFLDDLLPITRKTETWSIDIKTSTWYTYSWTLNFTNINLTLSWASPFWNSFKILSLPIDEIESWSWETIINNTNTWITENTWSLLDNKVFNISNSWSSSLNIEENTNSNTWSEELKTNTTIEVSNTWSSDNISNPIIETPSSQAHSIMENTSSISEANMNLETPVISENVVPALSESIPVEVVPTIEVIPEIPTSSPSNEVMPENIQTSFNPLNFLFPKTYALEVQNNNSTAIISSWSLNFSKFVINTSSWIISFSWTLDMNKKELIINSWSLVFSWTTYPITSWVLTLSQDSTFERDITIDEMITQFEKYFYFSRTLPTNVKERIKDFLVKDETWKERKFLPNNTNYKNKYIKAVIAMMLSQPEFLLQSWYDLTETPWNSNSNSPINWNSKLIMIELYGWYDWLHAMIPKNEYESYKTVRNWMNFSQNELVDLWDFYMNKSFEAFKPFYDSWELRIVNRVWAPNHSRWHDTAAIQVASKMASQSVWTPWIIWDLIKNETDPLKNIVLWTNRPNVYTNWIYLNVWWNSSVYKNNIWWTTQAEKDYQISTLKNILNFRSYPSDLSQTFKNSITLDTVANQSKASWWQEWSWYNLNQKLTFTKTLIDNNIWVTYYVPGWWGYDTHWDQQKWNYNLNNRTQDLAKDISAFFTEMKNKNKDVTIVVFSEFWRTLKTNWTTWTDHGQWWWYFILSTNNSLKSAIPEKVIWKLSVTKEYEDWFGIWVDYRAVYSKILSSLYGINPKDYFSLDYKLEDYINADLPKPSSFRTEFKNSYSNNINVDFRFKVEDKNYIFKDGSYMKFYYWEDPNNLRELSRWTVSNYSLQDDWSFKLNLSLTKLRNYFYRVELVDNQYDSYFLTWSFQVPEKITNNNVNQISLLADTYFQKYENTTVSWTKQINKIVLYNNTWATNTWTTNTWVTNTWITSTWTIKELSFSWGLKVLFWTWETSISEITSSSWTLTWNWWFLLPKIVEKDKIIPTNSKYNTWTLSIENIDNIVKIWADTLWVWMKLNQPIVINVPLNKTYDNYKVVKSEDLENWSDLWWNVPIVSSWSISFTTNHFTYFAIVWYNNTPTPNPWNWWWNVWWGGNSWGWNNNWWWSSWGSWWSTPTITTLWSWSWPGLVRDNCPSWDLSPSYYDKNCNINEISINKNENKWKLDAVKNPDYKISHQNYKWYEITKIDWYSPSDKMRSVSRYIISSKKVPKDQKEIIIRRINDYVSSRYELDNSLEKTKDLKNKYEKNFILLRAALKKIN